MKARNSRSERAVRRVAAGTVAILMTTMAGAMPDSWLGASTAHACGGLFCNSSQPVNQAAERIIFAQAADGTVTAVIQIMYQGPSEEFAWVLPVEGAPEVRVSADLALQRLQSATNPVYRMTTRTDGTCAVSSFADAGAGAAFDASAVADASAADAGVSVVGAGSVGPYDYVIISTDPSLPEAGDVAVEWLGDNGYDVDSRTAETLGPYLEGGSNLLAFRLTKGRDVGAIRPVMIGFGAGLPMIPIRPTAVAANRDMGILVWLLGGDRAVPVNYKSLELNEALINWFSPNGNYDAVVTAAADQAGGQGFVTELAGGAARFADAVYQDWERDRWQATRGADWLGEEGLLLNRVLGDLASWDGIRDAVRETVPLPSGATYDDLFACVSCYYDRTVADIDGFEPEAFLAAVEVHVIGPMEDTRQLFLEHGYVTRLYTTMSAEEMTMDPVFDFNAELGDVSNVHTAERVIHCSPSFTSGEAPWSIELPEGDVVWGTQNQWPFGLAAMPANRRILRVGDTGQGNVVEDHTEAIAAAIAEHNRTVPGSPTGPSPEGSPTDRADGGGGGSDATGGGGGDGTGGAGSAGGGCAVQGLATPGAGAGAHGEALLGLLAALLLASRRRR